LLLRAWLSIVRRLTEPIEAIGVGTVGLGGEQERCPRSMSGLSAFPASRA
jgi:hypothetical protein